MALALSEGQPLEMGTGCSPLLRGTEARWAVGNGQERNDPFPPLAVAWLLPSLSQCLGNRMGRFGCCEAGVPGLGQWVLVEKAEYVASRTHSTFLSGTWAEQRGPLLLHSDQGYIHLSGGETRARREDPWRRGTWTSLRCVSVAAQAPKPKPHFQRAKGS